ncbi:hypothetical protein MNV49_004354 [Pseudohyphozyma bogoriensis]|nr:hypothetical protein MNV49_004354 [Pseudohyphozyma bogoriensis]
MPSTYTVATFLSIASFAAAQTFYGTVGRFPCSQTVGGVTVANQDACTFANLQATNTFCAADTTSLSGPYGNVDAPTGGFKNLGYIPVNSECVLDPNGSGEFYCGFVGATCDPTQLGANTNCDNGSCSAAGFCVGNLGRVCTLDSDCAGNIYCLNGSGDINSGGVCGGSDDDLGGGATCGDGCAAGNFLCLSGACDSASYTCFTSLATASQRARARRNNISLRSRCPTSHTACPLSGGASGFECVDTTSNLEQCGACAAHGGTDCTNLPGVEAVGCVSGQCEIWACAEGHTYDAATKSCKAALVI